MKKTIRSFTLFTAGMLMVGTVLTGCASTSYQPKEEVVTNWTMNVSITVSTEDVLDQGFSGEEFGARTLILDGVKAWNNRSYLQAGDLLMAGYKDGKDQGWEWRTDAKISILSTAMRAYFIAGANPQEKLSGQYLMAELSKREQKYLSFETKIMLYWATMSEQKPLFEQEVPLRMKLADFVTDNR